MKAHVGEREGQALRELRDYFKAWQGHTIPAWNDEFFRASEVREVVRATVERFERQNATTTVEEAK